MASLSRIFSTLSFSFLVFTSFASANGDMDLIKRACKQMANYEAICISTLQSNPDSSNSDVSGFVDIFLKEAKETAKDTKDFLNNWLKETKEADFKNIISNCYDSYSTAVTNIDQAIKSLEEKNYQEVENKADSVMEAAVLCDHRFLEEPDIEIPGEISKGKNALVQMAGMASSAIDIIQAQMNRSSS